MIKVDKKKKIFILYMILFIFIKVDKKIEFTVFFIILVIALKFLQPYISLKWLILKEVRNRKYSFITEKGYISDLKKRREIALFIYWVSNIGFFLIIFSLSIFVDNRLNFINHISTVAVVIVLFGIVFLTINYLTGFYYYLVPGLVFLFIVDHIKSFNNITAIIVFIITAMLFYIVLTILLPLHSLRKVNDTTWLFGVLTILLVTIILDYYFKYSLIDNIQSDMYLKIITVESLKKLRTSDEAIDFIKANPIIIDLLNRIRELLIQQKLNEINSELSTVRFLILASYSIGKIIITFKIKLGASKAKDIYDKFNLSEEVRYQELRDCIFYGGEKYEDKIMNSLKFKSIVVDEETKIEKYKETAKWITIPVKMREYSISIMKKLI